MNYKYTLPSALIGVTISLVQPQAARAICSNDQVDTIGKEITVLIDSESPGSGVIIKQTGNIYTVITAYHVVRNSNLKYQIVTPDNQRYQLNYHGPFIYEIAFKSGSYWVDGGIFFSHVGNCQL